MVVKQVSLEFWGQDNVSKLTFQRVNFVLHDALCVISHYQFFIMHTAVVCILCSRHIKVSQYTAMVDSVKDS